LFSRAAMQSGAFVAWESKPMIAAQAQYDTLIEVSRCNASASDGGVACLQNMSLAKILKHAQSPKIPYGDSLDSSIWAPVVDGALSCHARGLQ
jgi:hypothetical protein